MQKQLTSGILQCRPYIPPIGTTSTFSEKACPTRTVVWAWKIDSESCCFPCCPYIGSFVDTNAKYMQCEKGKLKLGLYIINLSNSIHISIHMK